MRTYSLLEPGPLSAQLAQEVADGKLTIQAAYMLAEGAALQQHQAQAVAELEACECMAGMEVAGGLATKPSPQNPLPPTVPSRARLRATAAAYTKRQADLRTQRSETASEKLRLTTELQAAAAKPADRRQHGDRTSVDELLQEVMPGSLLASLPFLSCRRKISGCTLVGMAAIIDCMLRQALEPEAPASLPYLVSALFRNSPIQCSPAAVPTHYPGGAEPARRLPSCHACAAGRNSGNHVMLPKGLAAVISPDMPEAAAGQHGK